MNSQDISKTVRLVRGRRIILQKKVVDLGWARTDATEISSGVLPVIYFGEDKTRPAQFVSLFQSNYT